MRDRAEYEACVTLQRETWGHQFTDTVPATILFVSHKVGGITAGAFDGERLVGFVFSMSGVENGEIVHWSDLLAVHPDYRNHGLGARLKHYQGETLRQRGVSRIYWSFDPFQPRNAHINFNRLGIFAREYVPDMYGSTASPLHAWGTDRLIAIWDLQHGRPAGLPVERRIVIPSDPHALTNDAHAAVRAQFMELLPEFVVIGFERGEKESVYALTSASNFAA